MRALGLMMSVAADKDAIYAIRCSIASRSQGWSARIAREQPKNRNRGRESLAKVYLPAYAYPKKPRQEFRSITMVSANGIEQQRCQRQGGLSTMQ